MTRPSFRSYPHLASLGLALAAMLSAARPEPAAAHEFWLEVVDLKPKIADTIPVVFRNGQNFLGDSYPYLRKSARRFSLIDKRGERPIKAIEGDDPAAEIKFTSPGLAIVVYQGAPEDVVFDTFAKFEDSVRYEGLDAIPEVHRRAGKPEVKIKERFTRFAKALVAVGSSEGSDRATGLPLEIVAEKNPYELPAGEKLPVLVLYQGKPLPGAVVKVFHREDPQSPRNFKADADGRAQLELVKPGRTLVHAVHMLEPEANPKDQAHWSSLWASLAFSRK